MTELFLILSMLFPQLGQPSDALSWTDTVIAEGGSKQTVYRRSSLAEYSQNKANGKLDYRAMLVYRDGVLVCERRYYLLSATTRPWLKERYFTPVYNEDGLIDYIMTDNNTGTSVSPPTQVVGWQFFARDGNVETEIAFDGDGNWKDSVLRQFDAKGLCVRQVALTTTGTIQADMRFNRDEAGKVVGFVYGGNAYSIKYVFDDKGNWTLITVSAVPAPGQPLIIPWSIQRTHVYAEPP